MTKLTTTDLNEYRMIPSLIKRKQEQITELELKIQTLQNQLSAEYMVLGNAKDDLFSYRKRREQLRRRGAY